ncbi:MAG: adenylyltransferase/cytidyltransferase family protein [bacterium]|nr:adenylyltransferase/cytidyltransferase family protein [bacterium]
MIFHIDETARWKPLIDHSRRTGLTIASTNGTFDIVHAGHIRLLRAARAQGDLLVVGLNSDRSVKAYKSEKRPIVPQQERAEIIAAMRYVDMVLIFDEPESARFVRELQPDVHVKDSTYGYDLLEAPIVAEYGGKIHLIDKDDRSTTNIIKKVIEIYRDDPACL